MTMSFPSAVRGRWRPGARFLVRVGRRTLVDSLYLLTAPVTAAAGLLLVLGGLCVGHGRFAAAARVAVVASVLAPARWFAGLERWRIATVRSPAAGAPGAGRRPGPGQAPAASDLRRWLDVAHAVVVFPVALVTAVVTGLWWFVGLGAATAALRYQYAAAGSLRSMKPMTLSAGSAQSHIAVSLGLTSPDLRAAFGTTVGLLILVTLPLVTRACTRRPDGAGAGAAV